MKYIKFSAFCALITVFLFYLTLLAPICTAISIMTFETQYEYDKPNKAWLTDLTVKESISGISDMVTNVTLVANPDYPYTETAESFADEVADVCKLYELDENAARAAYVYLFEILNDNSSLIEDETSDAEIKEYLISNGIVYPNNEEADTLVMARALYTLMSTGELDAYLAQGKMPSGTALETAVVSYMSVITGVDMNAVMEWTALEDDLSLDEYILATSKYMLWSNGYDVSIDMSEEEVYRLVALMTIRKQGISAPDNLSFDEIKIRYLAVMLGAKYDVACDAFDLQLAMQNDNVAFYLLQLMGREVQLSLQPEAISYEEAFTCVCEETGRFDMELGEFYADVSRYTASLKYKRGSIWIYPISYVCNNEKGSQMITITVDDKIIPDGNFSEIPLDTSVESQTFEIRLFYDYKNEQFEAVYYLTVIQGKLPVDSVQIEEPDINDVLNGSYEIDDSLYSDTFIPNDSELVGSILGSIGLCAGFGDILDIFTSGTVGDSTVAGSVDGMLPSSAVGSENISSLFSNGLLTVLPAVNIPSDLNTLNLPDTSITMSLTSMNLFSEAGHTDRSNTVLSGIGGLELYSVAETIGAALAGGVTSVAEGAAPVLSSMISDLIFDDGETVVGASVTNSFAPGDTSNLAYVSALTDKAVAVYSNGDANAVSGIELNQYLSHQQISAGTLNAENAISPEVSSNSQQKSNQQILLIASSLCLSAAAGIVILVVSRQRKVTN